MRAVFSTDLRLGIGQIKSTLNGIASELGVITLDGWYSVKMADFVRKGGLRVVQNYSGSFVEALIHAYPHHEWQIWKFCQIPQKLWKDPHHQKSFAEWLPKHLGLKTQEDFYQVKAADIVSNGGAGLLSLYTNSINSMFSIIYPNYSWEEWKFGYLPKKYWENPSNCIQFFDWLGARLGIKKLEGWYSLSTTEVIGHGGLGLLQLNQGSLSSALLSVYPNKPWHFWRFENVPNFVWADSKNQKRYLAWLKEELNIKSSQDWYRVLDHEVLARGGKGLLSLYSNSFMHALSILNSQSVQNAEQRPLDNRDNEKECMEWIGHRLGVKNFTDWYKINIREITSHGGGFLLKRYYNSLRDLLASIYPEHLFYGWKFVGVTKGYWNETKNQREFFDWLGKELHIRSMEDWYAISINDAISKGDPFFSHYFGDSLSTTLMRLYPNYPSWKRWKFEENVQKGYWKIAENRRIFFDWLGQQLGVKHKEDWYRVRRYVALSYGALGLLQYYNGSFIEAIKSVYPTHKWEVWRFSQVPPGAWDDQELVKQYLSWVENELGLTKTEDWKYVTLRSLHPFKGHRVFQRGGFAALLGQCHPQISLETGIPFPSKTQGLLYRMTQELFPSIEVLPDYKHPDLIYESRQEMQLDIYIPSLKMAFEYQGEQHYKFHYIYGSPQAQQLRDKQKKKACKIQDITMIEIPYWWSRTRSSLVATILKYRPELSIYLGHLPIAQPIEEPIL